MPEPTRIGLPRSLLYHKYHTLWTTFFEALGCRVVVSHSTNRRILGRGLELAIDESCLPMKVFMGHVDSLRGRVDHIFIPRIESLRRHEHACVKFMGSHDIVRNAMPEVSVLTYDVDVNNGITEKAEMVRLAKQLGASGWRARQAYRAARAAQEAFEHERACLQQSLLDEDAEGLRILLVGHSYNLADELIGVPIVRFLESQGVEVLTSDAIDHELARKRSFELSPTIKWTYNKELLGAVQMYRELVDGIVFVVTFPCGPDSLMAELCHRKLDDVPITTLVLDELQGEAGLRTRLESFVDILKLKRAARERAECADTTVVA